MSESNTSSELVLQALRESIRVKEAVADTMVDDIARLAEMVIGVYERGGKAVFMGNGGSAADAQHLAGEMVGKLRSERRALPSLALNTNTSILTAVSNDYGYDYSFSRQVEAWVTDKDIVIGLSTSGNSPNVIEALRKARETGAITVAMTGSRPSAVAEVSDMVLAVPSEDTVRIQESHITIGHIVCELVEKRFTEKD